MNRLLIFTAVLVSFVALCNAHGMMMDPIGRASRWKQNSSAPVNYDDDQCYCGGYGVQWDVNGGKCGLCGDDYGEPTPRPHEIGGVYGEGVVVKSYKAGDSIPVAIMLTTNHWGQFTWDLCNMDAEKESDECFEKVQLKLKDGNDKYKLTTGRGGYFNTTLQIPAGIKCKHCVLRWTYKTANTWNFCGDGDKGAVGCGPQEHFRSCADIAINE